MTKPKIVAIIQARMNSSRLPGKVMLSLKGKPALQRLIERVQLSEFVDEIVVAHSDNPLDEPIISLCRKINMPNYEGPEEDVMERVLQAAYYHNADIIVDITGDCPFVDPKHIDLLIQLLFVTNSDYVSNDVVKRSWPDGLDIQVYYRDSLEKVQYIYGPPNHVGWNLAQYQKDFKIYDWEAPKDMFWPDLRLTLDTIEDYVLLSGLAELVPWPNFKVEDIIWFLKDNPHLVEINKDVRTKAIEEG